MKVTIFRNHFSKKRLKTTRGRQNNNNKKNIQNKLKIDSEIQPLLGNERLLISHSKQTEKTVDLKSHYECKYFYFHSA